MTDNKLYESIMLNYIFEFAHNHRVEAYHDQPMNCIRMYNKHASSSCCYREVFKDISRSDIGNMTKDELHELLERMYDKLQLTDEHTKALLTNTAIDYMAGSNVHVRLIFDDALMIYMGYKKAVTGRLLHGSDDNVIVERTMSLKDAKELSQDKFIGILDKMYEWLRRYA